MIKNTIIIVLILLLLITLYSYYCLSSRMVNFERERLEYILQKENDIKSKENKIKIVEDCSNKNSQFQNALTEINKILKNIGITCENTQNNDKNDKNDNIIKGIENIITGKIDPNIVSKPNKELNKCLAKNIENIENTHNIPNIKNNIQIEQIDQINQINSENKNIDFRIFNEVPLEFINNVDIENNNY